VFDLKGGMVLKFLEIKNEKYNFIRHIIIFYFLWAFSEMLLFPFLSELSQSFTDVFSAVWKVMIWLLPVVILLKAEKISIFTYLKLNSNKNKALLWSALGIIFIASYHVFMHKIFYTNIKFSIYISFSQWFNTILIAGFIEEILFRGYFLQQIRRRYSFWQTNLFVSILFLSIHFPIWYIRADTLVHGSIAWAQLMTFIFSFSLIQGWVFQKSDSLWPCIVMHMMNNFMALALVV
jgi:uncharacterized protein